MLAALRPGAVLQARQRLKPTIPETGAYGIPLRDEIELVDVRERELTIKGQEILTADKVAIRVSILVEFRVTEPPPRYSRVSNYEDRLY